MYEGIGKRTPWVGTGSKTSQTIRPCGWKYFDG